MVVSSNLTSGTLIGGASRRDDQSLERGWTLYKLTAALSIGFGGVLYVNGHRRELEPATSPKSFVGRILLLRQALYLTDVPLMYALLMACAAGALWLLARGRTETLVGGSAALWLLHQVAPEVGERVPWRIDNNEVFQFAAWQLLFLSGLAAGYHSRRFTELVGRGRQPLFATKALRAFGARADLETFPHAGHELTHDMLVAAFAFLDRH